MKLKWLSVLSLTALLVGTVGCETYVDKPVPPVEAGQCEYHEEPFYDEADAGTRMVVVVNALSNVSSSGKKVDIIRQQTYKTSYYVNKKNNESGVLWGFQVVFACSNAEIKFETQKGFKSETHAENAMNNRKFAILDLANAFGGDVRFLAQDVDDYATDSQTTCYDVWDPDTGQYYRDCTTTYSRLYKYSLTYAIVKTNGNTGGRMRTQHLSSLDLGTAVERMLSSPRNFSSLNGDSDDVLLSVKENAVKNSIIEAFESANDTIGRPSVDVASRNVMTYQDIRNNKMEGFLKTQQNTLLKSVLNAFRDDQ